jgi:hypothetical protein
LNCDFLRITTGSRYLYFIFASLSAAGPQSNLRVFQICGGESVSEEDFFGQRYLVSLDRCHQLVAVILVGVNPRLGLSGFFLQRCRVSS